MKKDKRARGIYTVIWILSSETIFQLNQLFSNSEARTREPARDINNPMFATALQVFRRPPLIQRFLFSCNVFFSFSQTFIKGSRRGSPAILRSSICSDQALSHISNQNQGFRRVKKGKKTKFGFPTHNSFLGMIFLCSSIKVVTRQ